MALTKLFRGKRYYFHAQFVDWKGGERQAEGKASNIRAAGGFARITTEGEGLNKVWILWSRERRY